ncbi:MAG: hypothetical protein HQL32_09395 [Planctomycetes bacterium]|nr:hypothetical protein [Planctomycetota bacterium]
MKVQALYLHGGWNLNYPFSPRLWSVEEWIKWLRLISKSGVERLYYWPAFELFSHQPQEEELAYLLRLQKMVKAACRIGIRVLLGRSVNTVLSPVNENKPFYLRNQNDLESVHPLSQEMQERVYQPLSDYLGQFDGLYGWWLIDRDPGDSYDLPGSVFVECAERMFSYCPGGTEKITYWLWGGWTRESHAPEGWREKEQKYWLDLIDALESSSLKDKVEYLACWKGHHKSLKNVLHKTWYFPYNYLEPEPSLPWTANIDENPSEYLWDICPDLPLLLNMQTPCLRTAALMKISNSSSLEEPAADFGTTKWSEVEDTWCWSDDSLKDLRTEWQALFNSIKINQDVEKAIIRWRKFCGMPDVFRRGYLHQLMR